MDFHKEREYWLRHNPDKAPDVPFDTIIVEGVKIISRYAKRDELVRMSAVIRSLPHIWRRHVNSIFCDSQASHCYSVKLDGPHPDADAIGMSLSLSFLAYERDGGHNGISVGYGGDCQFWGNVSLCEVDPDWGEYFDDYAAP